jgi:hypothetical protein
MSNQETNTNHCCTHKPPLRAVHSGLFPTFGSLQEVLDFADSRLPITDKNEITSILMIMQNTLLDTLRRQSQGKD